MPWGFLPGRTENQFSTLTKQVYSVCNSPESAQKEMWKNRQK